MIPSPVASRHSLASTGLVRPPTPRRRGERGAILVHVAVAMMGLLAFSALTIDLGTLWVARAQAQNAADAGALAGGVSLAFIDPTDTASATAAATTIVQQHQVWGRTIEPASIQTAAGACPTGAPSSPGACLQVRVARDNASGTPLPVFFSRMFGVNAAEVHSTASAKVMLGNAMPCPRPIAIPDRWIETLPSAGTWTDDDVYNKYIDTGYATPPPNADSYLAPDSGGPGSGITVASMAGVRVRREQHRVWTLDPLHAGDFLALDLPRPGGSTDMEERYVENFTSCSGQAVSIGQQYPVVFPHTRFTRQAITAVMAQDPSAVWDGTAIRGSAFTVSPRVITIAVIDPDDYARQVRPSSTVHATVRNLVGFFVDDHSEDAYLEGVIIPASGLFDPAAPSVTDQSTFLRTVALVR